MSRVVATLGVVILLVAAVSGQSRTADGVAALARGDYQQAVEILKPIAEDWRSKDTVAQFFMASLYESGHGVPADPVRACALYMRAGSNPESLFGHSVTPLLVALMSRGKEFSEECQLLATVGFDAGFEPVAFDLAPGHFVEWTQSGVTITYDGRTKHEPIVMALQPGSRFLSLQHTELATGPTRSVTRHFIDAFFWFPTWKSGQWTGQWALQWQLFEIVRDEIIHIDTPGLIVTVDGDAPPSRDVFNARDYAVVRVDARGNTEWAVLKGPETTAQPIETDTERRESRDDQAAHDAALKAVDWNRKSDVNRPPTLAYVDAEGCGWAEIVGTTTNRDEVIVVRANLHDRGAETGSATFDLTQSSPNISIEAYVYDAPQRRFNFCTDAISHGQDEVEPEVWRATAGTVSIELSPPGARSKPRATVTLTNVILRNSAGAIVKMSRPVKLSAVVGAVFG